MSIEKDKQRLSQMHTLKGLQHDYKLNEMITVYQVSDDKENHSKRYIYCALIPSDKIQEALANSDWDLRLYRGMPGGITYHKQGKLQHEYLRYGVDNGIEPLIINRYFYRLREEYSEISEEFRLFHELYHDKKMDQYLKIDDVGNEEVVAIVKLDHIQIRLKEIRQFLAIKEMHLAIQFVFHENSIYSLEELDLQAGDENEQDGLLCWLHRYGNLSGIGNCRAFSRLVGKRLIDPLPKVKSDFFSLAEKRKEKYENVFEQRYWNLQKASQNYLGENWILPLSTVDTYHLNSLRIPATDEQRDFDEMVLSLTKILIDSLNIAYLKKMIPFDKREEFKDIKGITLLECALNSNDIGGATGHIDFLRKLQNLRSSGSAHRKGSNYHKIARHFGIEDQNLRHVFTEILKSATNVLDFFISLIKSGQIREIVEKNQMKAGYAAMGEMIGIADFDPTDASVNHDDVIYETQSKS